MTCNSLFSEDVLDLCQQLENLFKSELLSEEYSSVRTETNEEKEIVTEENKDCPFDDKFPYQNIFKKIIFW